MKFKISVFFVLITSIFLNSVNIYGYNKNNYVFEEVPKVSEKISKNRNEIEEKYKWNLDSFFKSDDEWKTEYDFLNNSDINFDKYNGKLNDMKILLEYFKEEEVISNRIAKLYVYAALKLDEDTRITKYQSMTEQAYSLAIKYESKKAFVPSEILAIDQNIIKNEIISNKDFKIYEHLFNEFYRQKDHILSPLQELIFTESLELVSSPSTIYKAVIDADMRYEVINDGDELEVSEDNLLSLLMSKDQNKREKVFRSVYNSLDKQKNTFAAIYNASVKGDAFVAKTKNYDSSIDYALSLSNIPKEVYSNLISTVKTGLPTMHEYISLRKEILGLDELHLYDLYLPITEEVNRKITYNEAKETVLKALAPLGKDYVKIAREGLENGWVDIYPNDGKTSGAYSWGTYKTDPVILLNFDNSIDSMFTLAHELGHAMHSYYTWNNQPYIYSEYPTFTAEVASTVNECLLSDYLIKTSKDDNFKKYILNYNLDQFKGTMIRQTLFAEFEMKTHELIENGEPLTIDVLNELYKNLNIEYYGHDIVFDDLYSLEWARIPHFYNAFYVYQYATGYSAAVALSKNILENGTKGVNSYIEFLKSGSSNYPIEILKKAGVDMSNDKPIKDALEVFAEMLKEFKNIKK